MWYPPITGSNMKTFCRARERKLLISSFVKHFLSQPSYKFIPLSRTSWHQFSILGLRLRWSQTFNTQKIPHLELCVPIPSSQPREGSGGSLVKAFHHVESRCVCRPLSTTMQAITAIIRAQGKFKTPYCLDFSQWTLKPTCTDIFW
jgi:hypothetical protein